MLQRVGCRVALVGVTTICMIATTTTFFPVGLVLAKEADQDQNDGVQEDASYLEILNGVREFRDGLIAHFGNVAREVDNLNQPELAEKVREFTNNWLSLIGWSTGITGLVKDFVMTYFGRAFFHDRNGPLINSVRFCATAILHEERKTKFPKALKELTSEGLRVFSEDGALRQLFKDLHQMTTAAVSKTKESLAAVLASTGDNESFEAVAKALRFLSTDLKSRKQVMRKDTEEKDLDDDWDDDVEQPGDEL
ncbi:unnamed protein product [Amoebophrya sp. A120]|nr:unnamed protein product [Amoebophrya sp. A120]|eukprot:GSA120T00014531001.1